MKLSEFAKEYGICYKTAYRWFKEGKLPYPAEQTDTGTIIVHKNNNQQKETKVYVYARVSTYERKDCLVGQIERCIQFANAQGLSVDKSVKEIASGMNDKRPKLMAMLNDKPTHIIVENKDRLTRFGFNYIETLLNQIGCQVIVLNKEDNDESDLMKDLISVITSFCCRLYGLRRGRNKATKLKKMIKND